MKRNAIGVWASALLTVLAGKAKAVVVSGAVVADNNNQWGPETSLIIAAGTAEAHCYGAYIVVSHLNNELRIITFTLGSAQVWFQVAPGTAIDAALVLGEPDFWGVTFTQPMPGDPWLLGYWMDDSFLYDPNPGDCFGWVRLVDTPSGLVVVDDAMENSGAGIYAGTRIVVPEPSNMLAWAAMWLLTKRGSGRLHT